MPLKGLTPGTFASFPVPRPTAASSGSNIKSTQTGTVTMTSTTMNVTIPAVDISKSVVTISVYGSTASLGINQYLTAAAITTPTNVQFVINSAASATVTVYWQIIEYFNVKSLQTGISNMSGVFQLLPTISPINIAKSELFFSTTSTSTSTSADNMQCNGKIQSVTSLVFNQTSNAVSRDVYWQVIEFY